MTDIQQALDRWLTTEPADDFSPYWESVMNLISERVFNIIDREDEFAVAAKKDPPSDDVVWKLYRKEYTPERAATFIERLYREKT